MTDLLQPVRTLALDGGLEAVASELPRSAGVVQLLDRSDRPLTTARPSNVRRWVHGQLGPRPAAATSPAEGRLPPRRPALDLRPLATSLRFVATTGGFEQRLIHERWLADCVPPSERRDLKPPFYLHLDGRARFPRIQVRGECAADGDSFGPFRDKAQAERALKPLHRLHALRPCDFEFEPAPDLPLGLGCFYAQVKTCAAPCLVRIGERAYRALSDAAGELLAGPRAEDAELEAWLPRPIGSERRPALIVERVSAGIDLFPVSEGVVHEQRACRVAPADLVPAALDDLWPAHVEAPGRDRLWLANWIHERDRRGQLLRLAEHESTSALLQRVRVVT